MDGGSAANAGATFATGLSGLLRRDLGTRQIQVQLAIGARGPAGRVERRDLVVLDGAAGAVAERARDADDVTALVRAGADRRPVFGGTAPGLVEIPDRQQPF